MAPLQISQDDSDLIADLHKLSKKSPKLVKSSTYPAPEAPEMTIRSWRMNEFKYYDIPSPFPTLARGIFTLDLTGEAQEPKYRIVARGYDKFFNIGEVPWTTWESLEAHTGAPYTLTLKSNGCIIFIAALTPSKLLVTSKHSIGPIQNVEESHAQAGHRWLRKHLESKGKTEQELAARLWDNNWTAVAELCDDNFEEHVLPYSLEKTGLHLHGINESTKLFKTLPPSTIDAFADEWGFIATPSTVLDSAAEVRTFTEKVGQTGKWNDEALEGFVVRTHVTEPQTEGKNGRAPAASPYAPGSSFFFKVKFDEPYMMYRDWREVTKMLLSAKGPLNEVKIPKSKMKRPETKLYVKWVTEEIKHNRAAFSEYNKGKGIISTRERYLEWMKGEEGKKDIQAIQEDAESSKAVIVSDEGREFGKTIIVPVAIPGCGKTAVAVALAHLFGFGHTQSDDVHAKKAAPIFIKNVTNLLKDYDVVIADKNNHLRQHRQQLRDATSKISPPVRLFALNWSLDKPPSTVHRICGDRVLLRGDNHQSLRADRQGKAHEDVIWLFINTTEELADNEVDASVDIDIESSLEEMLDQVIEGCVKVLGIERPSKERVEEALEITRGYEVTKKKADVKKKDEKASTPRYFGLLAEVDLENILEEKIAEDHEGLGVFWRNLKEQKRIAVRPHVTIVHKKSLPAELELWERCTTIHRLPVPPLFSFKLGDIVWNDRIMAVTVEDLQVEDQEDAGQEGHEFVSKLAHDLRNRLHITIGTRDADVPPVEAMSLVKQWRKGEKFEGGGSFNLGGISGKGRIKGMFS